MSSFLRAFVVVVGVTAAACSQSESVTTPRVSAAPAAAPVAAQVAARPRIIFLGDSLTAGYGLDLEQSVPSLIQKHLDAEGYKYEVVNAGVSGDTSAGGLRRLEWSLDGDVRILVVELGANDGLRGLPVAGMKQNLKTIIGKARDRGIEVLLTGMEAPPNYGPAYTSDFRRAFRDLAAEERVAFMSFYLDGVAGNPSLNIADGMHPNPAGARIVEANLWQALRPMLRRQDR
jgi:acyl-CoA thioesterase-1